ncbi:MAG: glycosyltransferase family 4 protein [Eubacteriales bacterium]|nr:glycosyltransferase family 4 protein [Eubacteriales bacterium]
MKIGIMVLSIGSFGKKGFYNLQEIGLAKAMDALCDETKVYKLVPMSEEGKEEHIEGTRHAFIRSLPSKRVGTNGVPDMELLERDLDALICFSDTQLMLPKVYRWAKKYHIPLFPYIGVVESHSTNPLKKAVIDMLFLRNVAVYRKCHCFVKTLSVRERLTRAGVQGVTVVPVGLDSDLLHADYEHVCVSKLKKKYGYREADKVLLFIGRLIDEKQPVKMIDILAEIRQKDASYKLLMVGTGELKDAVEARIQKLGVQDDVQMVERIPNSDIWELYRFADALVNLNQQEIFGMAILEAMYYGCKVVAWNAPGPNLIVESGVSGWIASNEKGIIAGIIDDKKMQEDAHLRIVEHFLWKNAAEKVFHEIAS